MLGELSLTRSDDNIFRVKLGDGAVAQAAREAQAAIRKASPWLQA